MNKILITGSNGFIGKALVKYLEENTQYDIISSFNEGIGLKDIHYIFHLAADTSIKNSIESPIYHISNNVDITLAILEYTKEYCRNLKKFFFLSTCDVFKEIDNHNHVEDEALYPISPYAGSKAACEMICQSFYGTYGLPIVICNISNIYGPYQSPNKYISVIIDKVLNSKILQVYAKSEQNIPHRQYLYIDDLISALILLMDQAIPGDKYNIASNETIDNLRLARKIAYMLNKSFSYDFDISTDSTTNSYTLCTDKIKQLGWKQHTKLDNGLMNTIGWYLYDKFGNTACLEEIALHKKFIKIGD